MVGDFLSPNETSELTGLPVYTLKHMADRHKIECFRTAGGHRRYPYNQVIYMAVWGRER